MYNDLKIEYFTFLYKLVYIRIQFSFLNYFPDLFLLFLGLVVSWFQIPVLQLL